MQQPNTQQPPLNNKKHYNLATGSYEQAMVGRGVNKCGGFTDDM